MKNKHRKFVSIPLAFTMMLCMVPATETITIAEVPSSQPHIIAQETVQGSAILHCFNWSFEEIKSNLPEIAAAGYTAVQTSPVQPPKDYNAELVDMKGQWWKLYQPRGFRIADEGKSWLGSATELTELCTQADSYGIKVIVDVVANHLANNKSFADFKKDCGGSFEGHVPYDNLSPQVDEDMKNPDYYHTYFESAYDNKDYSKLRFTDTQYQAGMPDLNTGNSFVQTKVLDFLKSCVDCGVDGFRFDIAKHIELPTDDESFRSDFWPTVINGVKDHAAEKGSLLYIYGEVTDSDIGTDINNYTVYMAVTDDVAGKNARDSVLSNNAKGLRASNYIKKTSAENCVLWAESHDTYTDKVTSGISDENIVKTWAIVGSRADSTSLFLARPNDVMGLASTDETWKSVAVAEVNKFKNVFNGQGEYLSSLGNTAYIERGTKGVVISKLDGAGEIRLNANKIVDGTYTDHVTGNTFTVANGVISGTVGSSGVAVVYNENDITDTTFETLPPKLYLDTTEYWDVAGARFAMYLWDSDSNKQLIQMFDNDGDHIYEASVPSGNWSNVLFARIKNIGDISLNNKWNKTPDLELYKDGRNVFVINDWNGGYWATNTHTHQFAGQPTWIWNGTSSAFAVFDNCYICRKSYAEAAEITSELSGNIMTYTATVTYNDQTYTDTQQIEVQLDTTLYLNTGGTDLWSVNNPRFAMYLNGGSSEPVWIDMVPVPNQDYIFAGTVPSNANYTKVIFCRMKDDPDNDWTNKKNQTNNLAIPTDGNALYTITGWNDGSDPDKICPGEWGAYTAPVPSEYTITWKNYDGTVLAETSVTENETPVYTGTTPSKASDSEYTYTFAGWTPTVTAATADAIYTATFTATPINNSYTITWKNYDGTVLETDTNVANGTMPSYDGDTPAKANTARYYYTFSGWTPDVLTVNGDTTYTAQFAQHEMVYYLVGTFNEWQASDNYKFVLNFDENNIVEYKLENVNMSKGEQLKARCTVNDKDTHFPKGGEAANYTVTDDGIYNIYLRPDYNGGNSWYRNVLYFDNVTPYAVTFDYNNDTSSETQTVYYGKTVTAPAEPKKYCYDFVGWYNGDTLYDFNSPVTSNLTLTAQWQEKKIPITYTDVNGINTVTSVSMANFSPETSFTLPSAPYLDGYDFGGWTVNGKSYNNKDDVLAQITSLVSDSSNVDVQVVYKQRNDTYQLKVTNGIIKDADTTEGWYKASDQIYVVADADSDSQIFNCWKASYDNGEQYVAGYEKTYAFRMPSQSLTLQAYYVSSAEDAQAKSGTAYIESVSKPENNKLSFVSIVSVPNDASIVKTGIIAQKADVLGDDELTENNALFVKYDETTCTKYRSFKYTWTKGNVSVDDTWCVRSYLVYTQDGKTYTTLSEKTVKACLKDFE